MTAPSRNPERLVFFSDGVFAIIITILVLELHPPHEVSIAALIKLWPSFVAYAVSYLFLAIVWVNHHHVLLYPEDASRSLIWANFAHLFSVSFVPFTTAWIADSELAPVPVSVYAVVFALINLSYVTLCLEAIDRQGVHKVSATVRRMMRIRSLATFITFVAAAVIAAWHPLAAMALICACLVIYLRPGASRRNDGARAAGF
ncbi:MAG: TMEM175 family protein [Rhodanobacter sp.]